jgi:hypothetical protein
LGGDFDRVAGRVAAVAREIGVAPHARPKIDDIGGRRRAAVQLSQRLEGLESIGVECDGEDL